MDKFTYEKEDIVAKLENYEWDDVWWEQTSNTVADRVLYVGDSISCWIRRAATDLAEGKWLFDGFGTSKGVDNPYFVESVRLFGKQQGTRKVVLFSNGLHGWHLKDETEFKEHYEKMVQFLMEEYSDATVALLLLTSVSNNKERSERVVVRNQSIVQIAEKYNIPFIDLYTPSVENKDMQVDGVHFNGEANKIFAKVILDAIANYTDKN